MSRNKCFFNTPIKKDYLSKNLTHGHLPILLLKLDHLPHCFFYIYNWLQRNNIKQY